MKTFRVNHVPWCAPEGLAALVQARRSKEDVTCACRMGSTIFLKRAVMTTGFK